MVIFRSYVVCLPEGKVTKKFAMLLLSLRDLPCALSQWLQRLMTFPPLSLRWGRPTLIIFGLVLLMNHLFITTCVIMV